jgi:hypothetical protein
MLETIMFLHVGIVRIKKKYIMKDGRPDEENSLVLYSRGREVESLGDQLFLSKKLCTFKNLSELNTNVFFVLMSQLVYCHTYECRFLHF